MGKMIRFYRDVLGFENMTRRKYEYDKGLNGHCEIALYVETFDAINAIADFKLNTDISTAGTKIYFFHDNDLNEMLAQKTAKRLKKHCPDTSVKSHCENPLINIEIMIEELDSILV